MPRDVTIESRKIIEADTKVVPSPRRADWVVLDAEDVQAEVSVARVESYDEVTDTIVGHFVSDFQEGETFAECLRVIVYISYDNGQTWERVGHVGTGPEIVRRQVSEDPNAVKPVITHTRARWPIKPEKGFARLLRYEYDCKRRMNTEMRLGSNDKPGFSLGILDGRSIRG